MHDWVGIFHSPRSAYPVSEIALKITLALSLGLLVGFEREWSNKDIGARTFALASLLGLLGSLLGTASMLFAAMAILILITFANLRGLRIARKLEATTSAALAIIFLLGILVGQGHLFTPVACSIVVTMLLSLKPQFRAFAGGLSEQEVRSAIVLALLGFVIWPLLPNRFVDRWNLLEPREAWIIVVIVACLGFLNYVLLRVYGQKGIYLTAIFGGLVNSTASVVELTATLAAPDLAPLTVSVVLLTSIAMFVRNILILAIFAPAAIPTAVLPLTAMSAVACYWIFRDRRRAERVESAVSLALASPVSLRKVLRFALLLFLVQVVATLARRIAGVAGFQTVAVLGGFVSSASTTAASASMAMHGRVTFAEAGVAAVITSMASAAIDLPIVYRQFRSGPQIRELAVSSFLQMTAGVLVLISQERLLHLM